MVQHRLKPVATDIAVGCSVNGVAKRHVVGRHRFGDRSRSAADMKKSSSDLLAGADLGEGPVLLRVEIDLECLLIGADIHLRSHTQSRCGHLRASQPNEGGFYATCFYADSEGGLETGRFLLVMIWRRAGFVSAASSSSFELVRAETTSQLQIKSSRFRQARIAGVRSS